MIRQVLIAFNLTLWLCLPCFGQEKVPKEKSKKKSDRKYGFRITVEAGKQQAWIQFIRQQKALSVVKTSQGFIPVDFALKTVMKPLRSKKNPFKKYDSIGYPLTTPKALLQPLFKFLEGLGYGSFKAMSAWLYFPIGRFREFEKAAEKACYQGFISMKDVTRVHFVFRKNELKVGFIEFREKGQIKRF